MLRGSNWPLFNVSIFLTVRLIIALVTVFAGPSPYAQMVVHVNLILLTCCYIIEGRPMESPFLNRLELVNQYFLLTCTYFLFLFTDFLRVEDRIEVGKFFFNYVLTFSGVNMMTCVALILWEIVLIVKLMRVKDEK